MLTDPKNFIEILFAFKIGLATFHFFPRKVVWKQIIENVILVFYKNFIRRRGVFLDFHYLILDFKGKPKNLDMDETYNTLWLWTFLFRSLFAPHNMDCVLILPDDKFNSEELPFSTTLIITNIVFKFYINVELLNLFR